MKFEEAYEIKPMLSKTSLRKSLTTYNILYIYRGNPGQIFGRFSVDSRSILCRFSVDSLSIWGPFLCRRALDFSHFGVDLGPNVGQLYRRFWVDFETFGTILGPTFLKTSLSGVVNSGLQIAFQKRAQKRLKIVF
jgi:hypothetical protein